MYNGIWIEEARKIKGWTRSELSRRTGISESSIDKYERRGVEPGTRAYLILVKALQPLGDSGIILDEPDHLKDNAVLGILNLDIPDMEKCELLKGYFRRLGVE